jgi:hypothetical protein
VQVLLQQRSHLYSQEQLLHQRRKFHRPRQKLALSVHVLDLLQRDVVQKEQIFVAPE